MNCRLDRKGQSIVELTLITPILLVALYVPFDFGMSLYAGYLTQNVARDGARRAATTDLMTSAKATTLATQMAANLPALLVSGSTTKRVTVNYYATGAADCLRSVEVIAQGTYNFFWYRLIGLIGLAPQSQLPMIRTTKMRYEFQPDGNSSACSTTATATGNS